MALHTMSPMAQSKLSFVAILLALSTRYHITSKLSTLLAHLGAIAFTFKLSLLHTW